MARLALFASDKFAYVQSKWYHNGLRGKIWVVPNCKDLIVRSMALRSTKVAGSPLCWGLKLHATAADIAALIPL